MSEMQSRYMKSHALNRLVLRHNKIIMILRSIDLQGSTIVKRNFKQGVNCVLKRVIIGAFISLCSAIIDAAIIITAGIYSSSLTSWSGKSKFWYAIFGAQRYGNEANLSLNLGELFIIASILFVLGIIIMIIELFNTDKK